MTTADAGVLVPLSEVKEGEKVWVPGLKKFLLVLKTMEEHLGFSRDTAAWYTVMDLGRWEATSLHGWDATPIVEEVIVDFSDIEYLVLRTPEPPIGSVGEGDWCEDCELDEYFGNHIDFTCADHHGGYDAV